jgi:hypothetical protein
MPADAAHNPNHRIAIGVFDPSQNPPGPTSVRLPVIWWDSAMKLICGIALVLGLMMLRDGIALGLIIALAVLPLFDWVFLTQDGEENFRADW